MAPKLAPNGAQPAPVAGIINVNPANIQQQPSRSSARLKVVVRRLPPGLTEREFVDAFGEEWQAGQGRVDWFCYRPGKLRSPGKHPDQSRAYLHFTNELHIKAFETKFLSITFHDAKGTHRHQDLKFLPPSLEFAPSQRIPTSKPRLDSRQGLIDQDPEYMAFLESETMAIPRAPAIDANLPERTKEAVTSTPLIEALREKKAAKAKVQAAKGAKQPSKAEDGSSDKAKNGSTTKDRKSEPKTAAKDAKNKESQKSISDAKSTTNGPAETQPVAAAPAKRRERAPASIKDMLQRDLGLAPKRPARAAATADSPSTGSNNSSSAPPTGPAALAQRNNRAKSDKAGAVPPAQSANDRTKERSAQSSPRAPKAKPINSPATGNAVPARSSATPGTATNPQTRAARSSSTPTAGSRKAYLKHANASQGVTEDLLKAALSQFGDLVALDIDKRKGTALAEFKSTEGLAAATAKRSVPVAQGAVEVLEFKEKSAASGPRGGGSGRGARGSRGRGAGRTGSSSPHVPQTAAVAGGAAGS